MIEGIKLQNVETRARLELDMVSTPAHVLNSVDWGAVESTHHAYKYVNQIGVYVIGTSLETRSIVIQGWVIADTEAMMTKRKQMLNRFFNPQQAVDLFYKSYVLRFLPNTSVRYSAAFAENNEVICKFKIEGFCPDPLFSEQAENKVAVANTVPKFHFPLIIPNKSSLSDSEILSLTARDSTTASIAEVDGVKDVSGNGNHGRAYGGVEVVGSEMGKVFQFDGVNDYVLGSNVDFPGDVTLSAWIRPVSVDNTSASGIIGNLWYSPGCGITLNHLQGGRIRVSFGTGTGNDNSYILSPVTIVADEWQHVAVTLNITTKTFTIYYNGISIHSQSTTRDIDVASPAPIVMGRLFSSPGGYYFNGLIVHPKMFNRALSPSEIKTLYMFPEGVELEQIGTIFGWRQPSLIVVIENKGAVDVGMKIVFRANGTLQGPSLFNINTQKYFKVNKTMQAGEEIVVNTIIGEKKIQGTFNGVTTNYFKYRDLDSEWLQLKVGDNLFRYDADDNVENLEVYIYFNNKYLEVQECY